MNPFLMALWAALTLDGLKSGAANPGGCLKGIIKWLLISMVVLALLGWLVSGSCTQPT